MSADLKKIIVLDKYSQIAPFLPLVSSSADQFKNALGFFATSVFQEFARKDQLYLAIEQTNNGEAIYAGHLLFDCRYPKASVLQMLALPAYRKTGVATLLLNHLKSTLIQLQYISIYARVAEDLVDANAFWEKRKFYIQRIVRGGNTRKRMIHVRSHELPSLQLFPSSGLSTTNPLGLDVVNDEVPTFLLDLNVLFDLSPRRPRNQDTVDLFQTERLGNFKFAISSELSNELQRTAKAGQTDQMQSYARIFPSFPFLQSAQWNSLQEELSAIVFPERHDNQTLTENDKSDLRHLATAIQHRLTGFITNDGAILNASAKFKEIYDIEIVSPTAFKQASSFNSNGDVYETSSENLLLAPIANDDEHEVHTLLSKLKVSNAERASGWGCSDPNGRVFVRQGLWDEKQLLGYLTWPAWGPNSSTTVRIAVDESAQNSLNATRVLLTFFLSQIPTENISKIKLEFPSQQVHVREVAFSLGFRGTNIHSSLSKLILGRIVTKETWGACRTELLSIGNLRLPDTAPNFRDIDQNIELFTPDGNKAYVSIEALESLLTPALFCLPGRSAVITPILKTFSNLLLGHSQQKSLLPSSRASLYQEKHYLSDPKTLKLFSRGTIILFYESLKQGGLGAIIAVARVKQAYLKSQDILDSTDLDPSVLSSEILETIGQSKVKTVTVFDNLFVLPNPVQLKMLQELGCGNPTDLITTRAITDLQLQKIISAGSRD